jgi:hypothetical protein
MGYIFESEISSIIQTVLIRTIGEDDSIRLRTVIASEIHPALKAYVRSEVEKLLQQERQKEMRSKRFSYSLPEIASLQRQIDLLLIQEYEFTRGEYEAMIDEAVHFQFNYLCRPQWTLLNFVFENKRRVSAEELERKLQYCIEYPYFSKLIKRYLIDRGLAEVSYEELGRLLGKIDFEVTARHSPQELVRMTRPLLNFLEAGRLRSGQASAAQTLPMNAAVVFFEDKKLDDIRGELERMRDIEGWQELPAEELAAAIERVRPGQRTEVVEPSQVPLPEAEEKFQQADRPIMEAAEPATLQPILIDDHQAVSNAQTKREEEPRIEISALISSADRKVFVRRLFHKNEVEFRNALDALERLRTWQEASHYLDQVFQANNIDPFSKVAIRFTDLVHSRYESAAPRGRSALGS